MTRAKRKPAPPAPDAQQAAREIAGLLSTTPALENYSTPAWGEQAALLIEQEIAGRCFSAEHVDFERKAGAIIDSLQADMEAYRTGQDKTLAIVSAEHAKLREENAKLRGLAACALVCDICHGEAPECSCECHSTPTHASLLAAAKEAREALARAVAVEESVTQGQERELREGYGPMLAKALAALAKVIP